MKISIASDLSYAAPSVMKHLETSDLIFKTLGMGGCSAKVPPHLTHKCIVLEHCAFSDRVLDYIITPTSEQRVQRTLIMTQGEAAEVETIRESLPKDVLMEIYDIRRLYSDDPLEVTICST